jgi:hypothetical protein
MPAPAPSAAQRAPLLLSVLLLQWMLGARGWEYTIEKADDLVCSGGGNWTDLGPGNIPHMPGIRSGDPNHQSICRLKDPAPKPITSLRFSYRYVTGYINNKDKSGAVMEMWAQTVVGTGKDAKATDAGGPIYTSPAFDGPKYSFDTCNEVKKSDCYSPNITVQAKCPSCTGTYLAFKFANNDRNVCLMLPITVHIDSTDPVLGCDAVLGETCEEARLTGLFDCGRCLGRNQEKLTSAGCSAAHTGDFCRNMTCAPSLFGQCNAARDIGDLQCATCIGKNEHLLPSICTDADEKSFCKKPPVNQ